MFKRAYDIFFSSVGLLVISPLLVGVSLAILILDGVPIFFLQERVGLKGRPFYIWKFRTMRPDSESRGPSVTKAGDPRITAIGALLRRTKLDELPQLWNVLKGEMSLVGPRPEVSLYADHYTAEQRRVLELKPGITDVATLAFREEEQLLKSAPDVEKFYLEYCVPKKIEMNLRYSQSANLWRDSQVILRTIFPF